MEELKAKLKTLASKTCWWEDEDGNQNEDFCIYDYAGGNMDDAYFGGERDGYIMLAREVLATLEKLGF